MAKNIVKAGFQTTVYDIVNEAVLELVQLGAKGTNSPKEAAADADIAVIMVRDDAQMEEVITGENGVLQDLANASVSS